MNRAFLIIDTAVQAAFDIGLSCIVVADGCATRNLAFEDVIIEDDQVNGTFMASLAAVFAHLTGMEGLEAMLENRLRATFGQYGHVANGNHSETFICI